MFIVKKIQQLVQYIFNIPQQIVRYISLAAARIFSPTDDHYPETGTQPFEGEIPQHKKTKHQAW